MSTTVFSTSFESYNVSHIIYAGAVQEIPEQLRKNDMTHSFRIITKQDSSFCYFKDIEAARKARAILESMMDSIKPRIFRSAGEVIDADEVISYGRIVKLKNSDDGKTHAFVVSLNTANEKYNQQWLAYKTEESAKKARAILWSIIESANSKIPQYQPEEKPETVVAECSVELEN